MAGVAVGQVQPEQKQIRQAKQNRGRQQPLGNQANFGMEAIQQREPGSLGLGVI